MMEMEDLIKVLKVAKYKIDKLTLTIEGFGDFDVQPEYIGSIVMEKDFDDYSFPFFELTLAIPNKIYREMRKKNTKITAYLRMKYILTKMEEAANDTTTNASEKIYFSKNFYVYGVEATPTLNEEFDETLEKALNLDKSDGTDPNNATTTFLLLYDMDALNKCKGINNEIITSGTLTDIVTRLLNVGGYKDVLMSPATNGRTYREFTLLPIRNDEQMERICNDYAMHDYGTRIFHDFDCLYILNKRLESTAWRSGEYKRTYVVYNPASVHGGEDASARTIGSYEDPEEECNYCTMFDCVLSNPTIMSDQILGSSYLELDSKTGNIQEVKSNAITANEESSKVSKMVTVNHGDANTINEMTNSHNNMNLLWQISLDSIMIDHLSPNKEFYLVFNSPKLNKYNGLYMIRNFITTFHKNDGDWFTTSTIATFSGTKK